MEELNTIRTLVTIGGVLASVAGAYYLMRYQIGELRIEDDKQEQSIKAIGAKLDAANNELSLLAQRMSVIGTMMKPDAVAEHHKQITGVIKDLEYLRRDVDELRKPK
tara:strand:- start:1763 stop:2083 length:321 start_codon:yes stop_codon:yes gene_type:complete